MGKLSENLCHSIEMGKKPVAKIAVCYQKSRSLAQRVAELLPYPSLLVDSLGAPISGGDLDGISHAIELYYPAEKSYVECRRQRSYLMERDCQILTLFDWKPEYLADDFWGQTDYRLLPQFLKKIEKDLKTVKQFHITSELGTDIRFSVEGRRWLTANGSFCTGQISQMPDGELYTCPVEETFNGVLVVDGTITRSWVPGEPQRLEFRQGNLVDASPEFAEYIKPQGPDIYLIGEFALGFNPAHKRIVNNISVDEKAAGTVHFALGDSYNLGKNHCQCHVDMVIREPKVVTDPAIELPFFTKELLI